ncbi:SMI1/KNR4 family protein [Streptosporangium sp. NPDC023963]|uniref:SMI1/KNR4 family protein n=1 Tax=Streptosporangium sp. NPDC023963 TaxID=3155608 RepID=UPI0034356486
MTEDEIVEAIRVLPNLLPPASPEAISQAEEAIGHPLPPLLRRLYLEIANGGFGPRGGILGVAGSEYEHHFEVADILDVDQSTRDDWPGMLWLFDWGAGIWSVMDSRDPAGPMWIWDPNFDEIEYPDESLLIPQNMTLAEWLTESLNGNLEKAFETSGLIAVSERRAVFDIGPDELEYASPEPLTDDEIIDAISRLHPLIPPAPLLAVEEAERVIGFDFPPLLRRIYLEVSNGGVGPGRSILGVPITGTVQSADIVEFYRIWTSGSDPFVPPGFIWLCDWGNAIWSLVDCRDPSGPMWIWDPMGPYRRPDQISSEEEKSVDHPELLAQNMTLAEWLTEWLKGSFTKDFKPSGLRAVAAHRGGLHRPFALG